MGSFIENNAAPAGIVRPLLVWYGKNARNLPWRKSTDPYRVWISEIMLQQTRVAAAIDYYERFLRELPDVRELAAVPEDRLYKLWQGLGYYSRARNLKKAAEIIVFERGGVFPDTYEELLQLPGIGEYTAGAIMSIAYGAPYPAVDGNVLRVLTRVLGSRRNIAKADTKKWAANLLGQIYPNKDCGSFTQALMELGALVCLPGGGADCARCPLKHICIAKKEGVQAELPVKTPPKKRTIEKRTVFLITNGGRLAIRKRKDGLLGNLWELPSLGRHLRAEEAGQALLQWGIAPQKIGKLPDVKHVFTHKEWHMLAYSVESGSAAPGFTWARKDELADRYAVPAAFLKYLRLFLKESSDGRKTGL
ncbi:MAG: A/G-specific adenine glycosylase [Christensenellaceae bacterium]|jgi:A/G-specific adenine glycosylase